MDGRSVLVAVLIAASVLPDDGILLARHYMPVAGGVPSTPSTTHLVRAYAAHFFPRRPRTLAVPACRHAAPSPARQRTRWLDRVPLPGRVRTRPRSCFKTATCALNNVLLYAAATFVIAFGRWRATRHS